jgi:Phage integrase family
VLERQRERTLVVEKATRTIIPWLFHRTGRPIKSFRRAWLTACRRAGLTGRIPHDFRRTAVRNLERAGVPRSTAMKMVGHKTESIYRRYAIVDEAMLKEGAVKLHMLHEAQAPPAPVIPLPTATRAKRVSPSTVRVGRARRRRHERAARAKSLPAGEKTMVGWDGIEPPTPGFSVLDHSPCKCA